MRHSTLLATICGVVALVGASCGSSSPIATDSTTVVSNATDTTPDTTTTDTTTRDTTTSATTATVVAGGALGEPGGDEFPDIIGVVLTSEGSRTFNVDVTMSSPYDTPERYADAWRVVTSTGDVLGTRELTHDHQTEQPFTRSLSGVEIPSGIDEVIVEGRDQLNGWGGQQWKVSVPAE